MWEALDSMQLIQIGVAIIAGIGIWKYTQPSSGSSGSGKRVKYPGGLYNDGNTCFMNSVIQALVSMPSLIAYLEQTKDENLKVTCAMLYLAEALKFDYGKRALRPYVLTNALCGQGNKHLLGYQQQDAQEFFQHVSTLLSTEGKKGTRLSLDIFQSRDNDLKYYFVGRECTISRFNSGKSPLTGLLASRITCMKCGYKSPLKHDTFDNLSLTIPAQSGYTLKTLLRNYTSPEVIQGFICDKCTMIATRASLEKKKNSVESFQKEQITVPQKTEPVKAKKKKKKKNSKVSPISSQRVPGIDLPSKIKFLDDAVSLGKFDIDFPKEIEKTKIYAPVSKQVSIESAPQCLCLHMQRSMYLPSGHLIKNNAAVNFEDTLDITDMILPPIPLKALEKDSIKEETPQNVQEFPGIETVKEVPRIILKPKLRFIYEAAAVILHYGHHEAGHFVTLRKIKHTTENGTKDIWYRISDATIDRVTDVENDVFLHGSQYAYMIFYERLK